MGLRRRIFLNNFATLAIATSGMLLGLAAANSLWRDAHIRVRVIEAELQIIDNLKIRAAQAMPKPGHYQPRDNIIPIKERLNNDSRLIQQFILQLEPESSQQGGADLTPDIATVMANLSTASRSVRTILEQSKTKLDRAGEDPASQDQVIKSLITSDAIIQMQSRIEDLEQVRGRLAIDLARSQGAEERGELLEVGVPLASSLLATALALLFAWGTSRSILRPIDRLNQRIEELRRTGNLHLQPLDQGGVPDEIRALNENFNGLIQRLSEVLEQLEQLSLTDPLTQVGNRRCFDQVLEAEVSRHRRKGVAMALLLLDLDHFKDYNDYYGHPAGDRCLIAVANLLKELFRRSGERICRIGGEEFAVILPNTGPQKAESLARRIVAATEDLNLDHRANPPFDRVSVSVGVSSGRPSENLTGSWLLQAADQALYRCKGELGRNTVASAPPHPSCHPTALASTPSAPATDPDLQERPAPNG